MYVCCGSGASYILNWCGRTVWVPATLKVISPMFLVTGLVDWWCGGCTDPEINRRWIMIAHTAWCMIGLSCDIESRTFSVVSLTCKVCTARGRLWVPGWSAEALLSCQDAQVSGEINIQLSLHACRQLFDSSAWMTATLELKECLGRHRQFVCINLPSCPRQCSHRETATEHVRTQRNGWKEVLK